MARLLAYQVPLAASDERLRQGDWTTYGRGFTASLHGDLARDDDRAARLRHIGKAIAKRAKAFAMRVHVANPSPVPASPFVDRAYGLDELPDFWRSLDHLVVALPLTPETSGIVGAEAFAAMRSSATVVNVGRGATIDERALYEALRSRRIAGTVIDTWYVYPSPDSPNVQPSSLPFHELPNVIMTPHMSGWTRGTMRRRQRTIAENIAGRFAGQAYINVVRSARSLANSTAMRRPTSACRSGRRRASSSP
jgi:phosphoglycerate dehydrogenase-like enzyme